DSMYIESEWAKIGMDVNYRILTEAAFAPFVYTYCPQYWDLWIWEWTLPSDPNYALYVQTHDAWLGWSDNWYYSTPYEENYSRFV
ncbi:TPA: hypothetical protein HA259_08245, partial [Thermoplasmata archaeon]|nr:hypothetical protein [Thermoplasmata archaeon]